MNIIETIKNRKSCRSFNQLALRPDEKKELERYISENNRGIENEVLDFKIIEKSNDKPLRLDYGLIHGHSTYLLGTSKSSVDSRVNYGYLMEKVVLKATEIGLSTCWVGYFDKRYFSEVRIEDGFEIPSIVIIGYSQDRQSNRDKFVRFTISGSKRQSLSKIFFDYQLKTPLTPELLPKYSDSLEMVRVAPSAGNTQPWRIAYDFGTKEFHFYKKPINKNYELRGLHDIDMGIAISHFELTTLSNNLSGYWIKHAKENMESMDDLQYIRTWKCE